MHPILVEIFGFPIYSFGLMVALAFLLGLLWLLRRAKAAGEDTGLYFDAFSWIIISAIVGARLFYVFFFPDQFLKDPLGTLFAQGGLVWYGGMVGVVLCLWVFARKKKLNYLLFLDLLAPPAALGLAIGRIGCFLAGCCYGMPCPPPWAVHFPGEHSTHAVGVVPTQLMESAAMALVAFGLSRMDRKKPFVGYTAAWFLVGYGLIRFAMEYFRGDRLVWLPGLDLSASQVISLGGCALGGWLLWAGGKGAFQMSKLDGSKG